MPIRCVHGHRHCLPLLQPAKDSECTVCQIRAVAAFCDAATFLRPRYSGHPYKLQPVYHVGNLTRTFRVKKSRRMSKMADRAKKVIIYSVCIVKYVHIPQTTEYYVKKLQLYLSCDPVVHGATDCSTKSHVLRSRHGTLGQALPGGPNLFTDPLLELMMFGQRITN